MGKTPLDRLREFTRLITAFGKVERIYCIPATDRKENDMEHSYMLAMLAWYLIDSNNLSLDKEKVLKCALAHDVVEVYAGDTYIYSTDEAELKSKPEREAEAAKRLAKEFPVFKELHAHIAGYVNREDPESRFVYALDKILPILLIHEDGGRSWREHGVKLQMIIDNKTSKASISPEIKPYFDELIVLLTKEENEVFG